MRSLRNGFFRKLTALLFLLTFSLSLFGPYYAMALGGGPAQFDFIGYESSGSSDMVNLATGDMQFTLPLLNVPGPEGSFSVPLSYNAGIGLDQESSWVGLGFSMNVGAITRSVVGFPDDANGDGHYITVQDLVGVTGWDTHLAGLGSFGWNSQQGHYGSLSLINIVNAEWDAHHSSVGVIGINVGGGVHFNELQFIEGVATIVAFYAAAVEATVTDVAASMAETLGEEAVKQYLESAAADAVASALSSGSGGNPLSPGAGYFSYSRKDKKIGIPVLTFANYDKYRIWLDQSRSEQMYGLMYFGNAPTDVFHPAGNASPVQLTIGGATRTMNEFSQISGANQGAACDVNAVPIYPENFQTSNAPAVLATDNFSVHMKNIGGSIAPYRLEVGSSSLPRQMSPDHVRLAPVKYFSNNLTDSDPNHYKVPFVYRGQQSNSYFQHVGAATPAASVTTPTYYYGLNFSATADNQPVAPTVTYALNDVTFEANRIRSDVAASHKIPQSNFVEWLSNDEIRNGIVYPSKFMDFLSGGNSVSTTSDRYRFRTKAAGGISYSNYTSTFNTTVIPVDASVLSQFSPPCTVDVSVTYYNNATDFNTGTNGTYVFAPGATITSTSSSPSSVRIDNVTLQPANGKLATYQLVIRANATTPYGFGSTAGIGGYCITGADGNTYHFSLPMYEYNQYSEIHEVANPTTKRSILSRPGSFAHTWALTAITGPDFVDRNSNGLVDPTDWGYWVKFNYGISTNDFLWRQPWTGFSSDDGGVNEYFSSGDKQIMYLNSIETRSHVALFMKSSRSDGSESPGQSPQETFMRLDEIALVSREAYTTMLTSYGLTPFSDQLVNLCQSNTFLSSPLRTFLNNNCDKRIIFNYDYSLCPSTANSYAYPTNGKLTLNSITQKGRFDKRTLPDYLFGYGNNPSYNINSYDGWGAYASGAYLHNPNQPTADADGAAWSLVQITNPLGSTVTFNYERDTYSSVAGTRTYSGTKPFSMAGTTLTYPISYPFKKITLDNSAGTFQVGDLVWVNDFYYQYNCAGGGGGTGSNSIEGLNVIAANATSITVDQNLMQPVTCNMTNSGSQLTLTSCSGYVDKQYKAKKGDGIRVASIVMQDEFNNQNKIRYLYNNDDNITSSGVVSKEPDMITQNATPFGAMPGYPQTQVIYGQVTVLNGALGDDTQYYSKEVYQFITPDASHYTLTESNVALATQVSSFGSRTIAQAPPYHTNEYFSSFDNRMTDRTSQIGKMRSLKIYDKSGTLATSSVLTYTESIPTDDVNPNQFQGIYSSGVLMFDEVAVGGTSQYHKMNRTTMLQYPYALQSTVTTKDGFSSTSKNLAWDYFSGEPTQKLLTTSMGLNLKTVDVPAYKLSVYGNMGSKAVNISNYNMLTAPGASYEYRTDAAGNNLGLVKASYQSWSNSWGSYRYYDGVSAYVETPAEATSVANPVWRKQKSYVWQGDPSRKLPDGSQTFTSADQIQGSGVVPAGWTSMNEMTRYDHYGHRLESKDLYGFYETYKMGYDGRTVIAEAKNAGYTEIAFSSAEDPVAGTPFFGGEVSPGSGTVVKQSLGAAVHTGDCALSVSSGNGFIYKPAYPTPNRSYRAAAWANSANGRLYYNINGVGPVYSAAPTQQGLPGWYLLTLDIPPTATITSLEVGVTTASGTVVFDDFRFQPSDAAMTCHVYRPLDYQYNYTAGVSVPTVSWVLDNNNLYTRYEISEDGLTQNVYRESIKFGGEKKLSETLVDYKRFHK